MSQGNSEFADYDDFSYSYTKGYIVSISFYHEPRGLAETAIAGLSTYQDLPHLSLRNDITTI